MSASGKSLLGLWLYRSGEQEWAVKEGSPIHKPKDFTVIINLENCMKSREKFLTFSFPSRGQIKEEPISETQLPSSDRTSIIFTLKHQVGALARALQVFQEMGINVLHIELHDGNESETVSRVNEIARNFPMNERYHLFIDTYRPTFWSILSATQSTWITSCEC